MNKKTGGIAVLALFIPLLFILKIFTPTSLSVSPVNLVFSGTKRVPNPPVQTVHYDFTYPDRASLMAAGWSFIATTAAGRARNTEQTTGAVVSYDQVAHPDVLRIPCDSGDLWKGTNNSNNTLFRSLPSDWTSIRLKLSFNPTRDYQQAGLLAYQNDDNYIKVTREYIGGNKVTFVDEAGGSPAIISSLNEMATSLYLRLDRDTSTGMVVAFYSLNGTSWIPLSGAVAGSLNNPQLCIFVGASPGGFSNSDLAWVEVASGAIPHAPTTAIVNVVKSGDQELSWQQSSDSSWLLATPASGTTPGIIVISVDTTGLNPGVYSGAVSVSAAQADNGPQKINVTLVINPDVGVAVSPWLDGHKGALSVSVDDGAASCYSQLTANGFRGTYVTNNPVPSFYTNYYYAGMELGPHLRNHWCYDVTDSDLENIQIQPNIHAVCTNTPEPCSGVVSLAWPCGFTDNHEEATASKYFLSARGYNFNLLEETTPSDFMNLKSFNSHEHTPYPPADLKKVVDMAEQQGKWANLVFHTSCNDDGAISYAATKDIWVAPIGTAIKYILQRDRFVLTNYQKTTNAITFSFNRLTIPPSPVKDFETAFGSDDVVTLQVRVDNAQTIASVKIDGLSWSYGVRRIDGKNILFMDTPIGPSAKNVEISYQGSSGPTIDSLGPSSALAGGPGFTLKVNGSNFVSGAIVKWNESSVRRQQGVDKSK